jgi:hypothetical protein
MDLDWSASERKRGEYDFRPWENLLDDCDRLKLRAILIFDYANPLYDHNESPHSDEAVAAFARWAGAAVAHFKGRHVMWEIYNEPNGFWRPHPDVNAYIKLAKATAAAIKAAGPDELCVGPALSGTDGAWLEPCYKAGLLEQWDAVTVHPYGNEPPEMREVHYRGVRALIDRYRPKGKAVPVISGEWGYSVAQVPPDVQGKLLARQFLFNLSQGIPLSIWYDWRDDGADPHNAEQNFGLVANAYHPGRTPVLDLKPAYRAAKTLTTQLDGFTFDRRIKLESAEDFALAFRQGDEMRLVLWTVGKPHPARVPVEGRWSVTDYVGNQAAPVEGTIGLTDGPKYLRRAAR